jgi:thiamine kinase-like enzyme
MESEKFEVLKGGNMNLPLKKDNLIYKKENDASETIHRLLCHVRDKGISWIPESIGIKNGKHILSFIDGVVPADTPDWLWNNELLQDVAIRLRQWHDATKDFKLENAKWLLDNDEANEVICHSDFAPYNIVFKNHKFEGLIDFDVCSPGSRLWDISYTLYRFVPLLPESDFGHNFETSSISKEMKIKRITLFLDSYSRQEKQYRYNIPDVLVKVQKRLNAISEWSHNYGNNNHNQELILHSEMYKAHAKWVESLIP